MTSSNEHRDALLDELLRDYDGDPKQILGEGGLMKQLQKRLVERALEGEMQAHLGYAPHERAEQSRRNARNGHGKKTVQSDAGEFEIVVPRDRDAAFEPQWVKKRQRRLEG